MKYLDHEYLVPIIIGSGKNATRAAKKIKKSTGVDVHIFAEKFSFLQRMKYRCHKVSPLKADFLKMSLASFAASLEEYYFPMIILCGDTSDILVSERLEAFESAFVVVRYDEIIC